MTKIVLIISCGLILSSCSKRTTEIVRTEYKDSIVYVDKLRIDSVDRVVKEVITLPSKVGTSLPCIEGEKKPTKISAGKTNVNITPNDRGGYDVDVDVKGDTCTYEKDYRYIKERYDSLVIVNNKKEHIENNTKKISSSFWDRLGLKFFKILSLILGVLWLLGITPKFIFKLIVGIVKK